MTSRGAHALIADRAGTCARCVSAAHDSCTRYLSSTGNPMIVPATQSLGVTGNQFTVKYPALGAYRAVLTLHSGHAIRIESAQ